METITFSHDITVLYVTASSFPAGIMDAFDRLARLLPDMAQRRVFGLSRPENGVITYHAAAEEKFAGEGTKLHCDTMILKKGNYISETINDFMTNLPAIGNTFQRLIAKPGIDPEGYCVEEYINNKDVHCMVRLAD